MGMGQGSIGIQGMNMGQGGQTNIGNKTNRLEVLNNATFNFINSPVSQASQAPVSQAPVSQVSPVSAVQNTAKESNINDMLQNILDAIKKKHRRIFSNNSNCRSFQICFGNTKQKRFFFCI